MPNLRKRSGFENSQVLEQDTNTPTESTPSAPGLSKDGQEIPSLVTGFLEAPIARMGLRLLEVQYRGESGNTLRLVIDGPGEEVAPEDVATETETAHPLENGDSPEGASLNRTVLNHDRLVEVSELAGRILDVEDPIPEEFSLEVTTPGIFRELREPRHFAQSLNKIVRISLTPDCLPDHKGRIVRGKLGEVGEDDIKVEAVTNQAGKKPGGKAGKRQKKNAAIGLDKGQSIRVPFSGIQKARLDPEL